ncbi:MAG: hypothetical protein P8L68_05125 [Paracoccaceae bacterium]|nr:hypothetical protein [Paracoccaceae bacterium]
MKYLLTENGLNLYLSKISALSDEYFHILTPWQRKFITSVYESFLQKPELSQKQVGQIDNIFRQVAD